MKREIKIERARKLREEDPKRWTYDALGKRFGVTGTCIQKWLKPEWAREKARKDNAKRSAAKRQWERENRAKCPDCGQPMGAGSRCPSARPERCTVCDNARRVERVGLRGREIEAWWAEGLTMSEIAEKLGWTVNHLCSEFVRLRKKGFHLPYRYTEGRRAGSKFPEQVAA